MVRNLLQLNWHSRRLYWTIGILVLCALQIWFFSGSATANSGGVAIALAIGSLVFTRSLLPPVVVLLAGSHPRSRELLNRIRAAIFPLRAAVLLDPARMRQSWWESLGDFDNLRTSDTRVWKSVVNHLIGMARVVVIDTREASDPVNYEVLLMLQPQRIGKSVFLGTDDRRCPSLERHQIDPYESAIQVHTVAEIPARLKRLTRSRRDLPSYHDASEVNGVVMKEDFESLPSVLAIGLMNSFDSQWLLEQAKRTEQDIIQLLLPLCDIGSENAGELIEMSYDFARNSKLVGMFYEGSGVVMFRRGFLLEHGPLVHPASVARAPVASLSFAELNEPDPVVIAVQNYCRELHTRARYCSLEFRYLKS